ncbi:MAG: peptidylprolyl isomerase [Alphaproteobacteria bacterium]
MANLNKNIKECGNALVITLIVLLVAGAGVFFYMSQNGMKIPGMDKSGELEAASVDGGDADASSVAENPVIAKIDGKEFRRQDAIDLMNTVPAQLRQMPPEQLFPMVVEQMINNEVIDKKASKAGLERDTDVKKQLAKVKEQIIRTKFLENTLAENMDEARVKAEYDAYLAAYQPEEEVRASHILVGEEKVANDLIKKLGKGESFEDLAKDNSLDGSGQNGGDLGFFTKSEVVPEFAEAAFSIEVGSYTKKPVKSAYGFHVIRVDEKRQRPADSYEQMRPVIEQNLRRVVYEEVLSKWKEDTKIERFDVNGKPLLDEEISPASGGEVSVGTDGLLDEAAEDSSAEEAPAAE